MEPLGGFCAHEIFMCDGKVRSSHHLLILYFVPTTVQTTASHFSFTVKYYLYFIYKYYYNDYHFKVGIKPEA